MTWNNLPIDDDLNKNDFKCSCNHHVVWMMLFIRVHNCTYQILYISILHFTVVFTYLFIFNFTCTHILFTTPSIVIDVFRSKPIKD